MAPKAKRSASGSRSASAGRRSGTVPKKAASPAVQAPAAAPPPPRQWPPQVPLGPIADILPMLAADDDDIDSVMLRGPSEEEPRMYSPEDVEYICGCLQSNTTVTDLNFSFNPLGDIGAAHVATLLESAPKLPLVRLSLNNCSIGASGTKALAAALGQRKGIDMVQINSNEVGDEGGAALVDMLKQNKGIKQLVLAMCCISEEVQSQIDRELMMR
eukprot:TRINITY_DN75316_c0_g1_i1.p2 TRINITY_DN75316_c0_g1~~TRINITY_DN75316_c0_g1_i1.p2  ORF type:complete len:232 (-),score=51.33 TRINITY_DN75316_c0_g1_i1:37-681(-)